MSLYGTIGNIWGKSNFKQISFYTKGDYTFRRFNITFVKLLGIIPLSLEIKHLACW